MTSFYVYQALLLKSHWCDLDMHGYVQDIVTLFRFRHMKLSKL